MFFYDNESNNWWVDTEAESRPVAVAGAILKTMDTKAMYQLSRPGVWEYIGEYDDISDEVIQLRESMAAQSGISDHSQLTNLEYSKSGHTGFATSSQGEKADSALQNSDIGVTIQPYNANTVVDGGYTTLKGNVTTNTADIATINSKIPAQATAENQVADKDFVNSTLNSLSADFITYNAAGDPFPTYAALTSATVFYNDGNEITPAKSDYCVILADENHDNAQCRYVNSGSQWNFQYKVNDTPFTAAQNAAINSGITESAVAQIGVDASSTQKGVAKLYNATGTNTDGSMTQAAIDDSFVKTSDQSKIKVGYTVGLHAKGHIGCDLYADKPNSTTNLATDAATGWVSTLNSYIATLNGSASATVTFLDGDYWGAESIKIFNFDSHTNSSDKVRLTLQGTGVFHNSTGEVISAISTSSQMYGVVLIGVNNCNIKLNTEVGGSGTGTTAVYGVYLTGSSNNNTIENGGTQTSTTAVYGVYLGNSSNNTIENSGTQTSTGTVYGVSLVNASNNNTIENGGTQTGAKNVYGVSLASNSSNNTIENGGTQTGTGTSGSAFGVSLTSSSNNNTIENGGTQASVGVYGVYLVNSSNNTIENGGTQTGKNGAFGVYLLGSSNNNTIENGGTHSAGNILYGVNIGGTSASNQIICEGSIPASSTSTGTGNVKASYVAV
jgi:hypothetical protein